MGRDDALWLQVLREIDGMEKERLKLISIFIFVLLPTLVAMAEIVRLSRVDAILPLRDAWEGGPAINNDNGISFYAGIFEFPAGKRFVIPGLSRLAFAVVIGQIVSRANQMVAKYEKRVAFSGIVIYVFFLLVNLDEPYLVAWILSVEFIVLAYYGLAIVFVALSSFSLSSGRDTSEAKDKDSENESQNRDVATEAEKQKTRARSCEKRPRIRNPRN